MTDATSPASGHTWGAESAHSENPHIYATYGPGDEAVGEPAAAPGSEQARDRPAWPGVARPAGWFLPVPGDAAPPVWPGTEPARLDASEPAIQAPDVWDTEPAALQAQQVHQSLSWQPGQQPALRRRSPRAEAWLPPLHEQPSPRRWQAPSGAGAWARAWHDPGPESLQPAPDPEVWTPRAWVQLGQPGRHGQPGPWPEPSGSRLELEAAGSRLEPGYPDPASRQEPASPGAWAGAWIDPGLQSWQEPAAPDVWEEPPFSDAMPCGPSPVTESPGPWPQQRPAELWQEPPVPEPWPHAQRHLPPGPVVGPTVALRGWAGGPGFAALPAAVPVRDDLAAGWSGWQHAQGVWQNSGIMWEPAAEPAVESAWSDYPPNRLPRQPWRGDNNGQVALPVPAYAAAPASTAPPLVFTEPQPAFAAVPPASTASQPVVTEPQPAFAAMPAGFAAMPLGAPTVADVPAPPRPAVPPPPAFLPRPAAPSRATRPLLSEPDELYRAWQGSVRQASARPKVTTRGRRRAWQVVRVGVPATVIVSVGAGAVLMLTGKPGNVLGFRANQASTAADALGSGAPLTLNGAAFSGYPGQRGAVTISSIASAGGIQLAAGSADSHPAIWRRDASGTWTLVSAASPALYLLPGAENLISIAHGPAGWIAVGDVVSGAAPRPVVVTSANGVTWQPADTQAAFAGPGISITAVAAGPDGYVVVGSQVTAGRAFTVLWWSADLRTWIQASNGGLDGRVQPSAAYAVAAVPASFVAVGTHGSGSAIWTSGDGRQWAVHDVPAPAGASAAVLRMVTVNGSRIVAGGYAVTRAGDVPIAVVSADGGLRWHQAVLSAPGGLGTVTALTAAGSGFIAAGQVGTAAARHAVTWSSPDGLSWSAATPATSGVREITALSASGGTVTGIAQLGADPSVITFPAP
jgi:hypothetical protein